MKKLILMLLVMVAAHIETKAQQHNQLVSKPVPNLPTLVVYNTSGYGNPGNDYDYYMHKSKRSRNTGLILLGSGVLISGIGAILSFGNSNDAYSESRGNTGAAMLITGALAGMASIPFMAIAWGYSNKAKATITNQKTGFWLPGKSSKNITGITMSIQIGK